MARIAPQRQTRFGGFGTGLSAQISEILKEQRAGTRRKEEIGSSAANRRLQALQAALGTLTETPVDVPDDVALPAEPLFPSLPAQGDLSQPPTPPRQGLMDILFQGRRGEAAPTPGTPTRGTAQETLFRAARRAPELNQFFERGSVKRTLERLGVSEEQARKFLEDEQLFPERQEAFAQAEQAQGRVETQKGLAQEQLTRQGQAQSVIDVLGFGSRAKKKEGVSDKFFGLDPALQQKILSGAELTEEEIRAVRETDFFNTLG